MRLRFEVVEELCVCVRLCRRACVRACVCVCKCVRACVRMSVAPAACLSARPPHRTLNVEKASEAISKLATSTFSKKSSTTLLSSKYLRACVRASVAGQLGVAQAAPRAWVLRGWRR